MTERIEGEGIVGVSRCPPFDWPRRGVSFEEALRRELIARSGNDLTAVVPGLDEVSMDGMDGVWGMISLDPGEAGPLGMPDGADGHRPKCVHIGPE